MGYDKMSDLVIDRNVFVTLFGDGDKDMERLWKSNKFRPTQDWKCIGSIIEKHNISIVYMSDDGWEAHALLDLDDGHGLDEQFNTMDKNPRRAAAICFLKIMEQQK